MTEFRSGGSQIQMMIRDICRDLDYLMKNTDVDAIPDILDDWDKHHSLTDKQYKAVDRVHRVLRMRSVERQIEARKREKEVLERKKQSIREQTNAKRNKDLGPK